MLSDAIEIRKITTGETTRYEVYDSDTGTSLGLFESRERAETERHHLQQSARALHIRSRHDDTDTG
ncbi:hypothetical protein [Modicisalibacter coralii]|uniref:hypothetical protein n=1 Tax=Modicisalibacter coralii TaxID=2304602 RepID=UPI00100B750D|nr:hypothetical protein [Halomonas coralii]